MPAFARIAFGILGVGFLFLGIWFANSKATSSIAISPSTATSLPPTPTIIPIDTSTPVKLTSTETPTYAPTISLTETDTPFPTLTATATITPTKANLASQDIQKMYERATVKIVADYPSSSGVLSQSGKGGTGVLLTKEGVIVTNAHVVQGASTINVYSADSTIKRPARLVGSSFCDDIAVIKINNVDGLSPGEWGSSDDLKGASVYVMGYRGEDDLGMRFIRGTVEKTNGPKWQYESSFLIDGDVLPGYSGGPVVNEKGEIIGIVVSRFDNSEEGINGVAVDSNYVSRVYTQIQDGYNPHWIGAHFERNQTPEQFDGVEYGLFLRTVQTNSPAEQIGLQPFDLIYEMENKQLEYIADVCDLLRSHTDGDVLKFKAYRFSPDKCERASLEGRLVIGATQNPNFVKKLDVTSVTNLCLDSSESNKVIWKQIRISKNKADGWNETENELAQIKIDDDQLVATLVKPGGYAIPMPVTQTINSSLNDVFAQVMVNGMNYSAGVVIRYSQPDFYTCMMSNEQKYWCSAHLNGKFETLIPEQQSELIKVDALNEIGIRYFGQKYHIFINAQEVNSFEDTRLTTGHLGLFLSTRASNTTGSIVFKNINVSVLK